MLLYKKKYHFNEQFSKKELKNSKQKHNLEKHTNRHVPDAWLPQMFCFNLFTFEIFFCRHWLFFFGMSTWRRSWMIFLQFLFQCQPSLPQPSLPQTSFIEICSIHFYRSTRSLHSNENSEIDSYWLEKNTKRNGVAEKNEKKKRQKEFEEAKKTEIES